MKKLLAIVSIILLLTVACKDEVVEEATAPVEAAPVEEVAPAVEEVVPAETVE